VDAVEQAVNRLRILVRPTAPTASCPRCGSASARVHSRYRRSLADLAIAGRMVEIVVRARRWRCPDLECPAVTFAEQIDGLTGRHTRRTPPFRQALQHIGLALAGRAGARLADQLGLPTSRSSMLRIIRACPTQTRWT
jgi:transposase